MKKIIPISFSILAAIVFLFSCKGQTKNYTPKSGNIKLSTAVKKIIDSIETHNTLVLTKGVGAAGSPTAQWENYQQLKKTATANELIALTDHRNGVVRCYAFQALAITKSDKVFPILLNHIYDTATIRSISGCMGGNEYVGDHFVKVVTPRLIDLDAYKLNDKEWEKLTDILKSDDKIVLYARQNALRNLR